MTLPSQPPQLPINRSTATILDRASCPELSLQQMNLGIHSPPPEALPKRNENTHSKNRDPNTQSHGSHQRRDKAIRNSPVIVEEDHPELCTMSASSLYTRQICRSRLKEKCGVATYTESILDDRCGDHNLTWDMLVAVHSIGNDNGGNRNDFDTDEAISNNHDRFPRPMSLVANCRDLRKVS